MRHWLFLLGGLIVWAAHFYGVYGIASLADVIQTAGVAWSRWATASWTFLCLLMNVALLLAAIRQSGGDDLQRFTRSAAAGGALLSMVAVIWQGLPAMVGH